MRTLTTAHCLLSLSLSLHEKEKRHEATWGGNTNWGGAYKHSTRSLKNTRRSPNCHVPDKATTSQTKPQFKRTGQSPNILDKGQIY